MFWVASCLLITLLPYCVMRCHEYFLTRFTMQIVISLVLSLSPGLFCVVSLPDKVGSSKMNTYVTNFGIYCLSTFIYILTYVLN